MTKLEDVEQFFPIESVFDLVQLFQHQLEVTEGPNLALLSILVGNIEHLLTCSDGTTISSRDDCTNPTNTELPKIEFNTINSLYEKFSTTVRGYVDLSKFGRLEFATRELVKCVSDVIWNSLARSGHKERAHIQSLYSYVIGYKLDCTGVAFAVVAACQILGFDDVHLVMSEDHAWVVFGEDSTETAEITWHGKGNEDKRGQPINAGVASKCWLYLNGYPVICDRYMEVAVLVSAINPSVSTNEDSEGVTIMQQELLWLLYDKGHLSLYPMALGALGDLEAMRPSTNKRTCSELYEEAVSCARINYENMHIYPYTYQGGYFYRNHMYKKALESWANVGDVLKKYNYTKDDDEIHTEIKEITWELIPHIMKMVCSDATHSYILRDPECYAYLLRLYDGICQWEEGSLTPVLHIGWAKPLVNTIAKFDGEVRSQLTIVDHQGGRYTAAVVASSPRRVTSSSSPIDGDENCNNIKIAKVANAKESSTGSDCVGGGGRNTIIPSIEDSLLSCDGISGVTSDLHPGIEELTAACGEKLLNSDFLLQGGGEPFMGDGEMIKMKIRCAADVDSATNDIADVVNNTELVESLLSCGGSGGDTTTTKHQKRSPVQIALSSEKMKGLKNLLLGEKLNTQAITLQLTAQSQVQVGVKKSSVFRDFSDFSSIPFRGKRARRE